MILIGSRALAFRAPSLLKREPKDFDFVCTDQVFEDWKTTNSDFVSSSEFLDISPTKKAFKNDKIILEFDLIKEGHNSEQFLKIVQEDKETVESPLGLIPSLDMLFALKASHRYLKNSPHFWKNLFDYHRMKAAGATIHDDWKGWFKQREKETYTYKHPKLNGANKADFFDPNIGVKYVYDHDSIHVAVKHLDQPAYRYFQKDNEQVACDREKFMAASNDVRLFSVLEESYVLAIERSQVPFEGKISPKDSFKIAFSKVLSSITSGWWREWAYDNALDVLPLYSDSYIDRFKSGIESGIVKPFVGDNNPYK